MNPKGPFVAIAAICDRVMYEKDGGISCIRFMDTIAVEVPADAPVFPIVYQGHALISFKSGDYVGPMTFRIEFTNPAGEFAKPPQEHLLEFQGGEHGTNLILQVHLQLLEEGLFYFNLYLGGDLVTRIPLRVRVTRKPAEQTNSEKG